MKLWYRCALCSPDQSKDFDIEDQDPPVSKAYQLVYDHHKKNSPHCPASRTSRASSQVAVEVILVRMVQ